MPRSSRSKSHKQSSKHTSSSTAREYSGSDDDVKVKERSSNGGKEDIVTVRGSSEKRKHNKDLLISHANGDVVSDKNHGGSDRWNGGSSDVVVNVDNKEVSKLKASSESKNKSGSSSRRHESDSVVVVDDIKSGSANNRTEKRKSEKESGRKESLYKENKESKDKDRSSDRGRKGHSDKVEVDGLLKQGENQSRKRGKEIDWPIEEELRNPELEKELEKRMKRRREGSNDKDKYQADVRDDVRDDDIKETRQRDEKHHEGGERDRKYRDVKHRGESERYNKHRDDKYCEDKYVEDGNKDNKYKDEKDERIRDGKRKQDDDRDYKRKEDKHRDVRNRDDSEREKRTRDSKYTSRDHTLEPETKRLRDDNVTGDVYHRKTSNRDESPIYDDRVTRYKDDKDRSRSSKDQRYESEKRKRSSAKVDSVSERGRPGGSSYPARDQYRVSKQEETKYRDYTYEDQTRHNAHSSRNYTSAPAQSDKKAAPKDESYSRPDSRSSPHVDKSPSSTSNNERRNEGPKSGGSKDTVKDGKGSRDPDNEFSQADNDNISVSSPYVRNSKSLLPPPSPSTFRTGSDSPFFGSSEDDRNKSNNRHRRMVDPNMGRAQGNWKNNVPNWPSPMASGGYNYNPFQHVPPPPMFHPLMQQFPPPMFGRPPMKLNPGLPYHLPDHGRPPMHGWDANEPNLYGRVDWDHRNQLNNQGWDQWKAQNAGPRLDVQSGPTQDGYSARGPTMGQPDESEQSLILETNALEAQKASIRPQIVEPVKEDNSALMSKAYLSRVDVSRDLTHLELFDQCTSMMDLDQEHLSDDLDCKILFFEEGVEADDTDCVSLFTAVNDSVFQKAMLLYKKQKDEFNSMNGVPVIDQEKGGSDDNVKPMEEVAVEGTVMAVNNDTDEPPIQKLDTETNVIAEPTKTEEPMDIEVDRSVVKQEEEPDITMAAVEESVAPSAEVAVMPTESTNDGGVLSDVSTAEVAVMPTESIEFGSVNLNRIHHHSSESTH